VPKRHPPVKLQHSPGPFYVIDEDKHKEVRDVDDGFVGEIYDDDGDDPVAEANAALFCAAPALLNAARAVMQDVKDLDMYPANSKTRTETAWDLLYHAIKAAEGRAPRRER
jgi:hypothetical protein